jgi:hypothetical protein
MRRVARHLMMLCFAISLLLGIATCALWARSRSHMDIARAAGLVDAALSQSRVEFYSSEGVICFTRVRCEHSTGPVTEMMGSGFASLPVSATSRGRSRPFTGFGPQDPQPFGFGVVRSVNTDPPTGRRWTHWALSLPHWFVALLLIVLPARTLIARFATWRRQHAGRCLTCGYDIRASLERCPECGNSVTPQPSKAT